MPDTTVIRWLNAQTTDTLFLATTSLAELLSGVERLPKGKKKHGLSTALRELTSRLFGPRILPFDQPAAIAYSSLVNSARSAGYTISMGVGQIAATASVHGFSVATRDTSPFAACAVSVINPWIPQ